MALMSCIPMASAFRVATWCTTGTMKSRGSSFLPLGIECRYRAFWWIMKFCWFCTRSVGPPHWRHAPLECVFSSVFFWASNQSKTTLSTGSSLWASAQSVTCIWTNMCPAVTCTSCSKLWSPSTTVGSWISHPLCSPQGYSIKDQSHYVWVKAGSNPAQYICHSVVPSFLVLQLEIEAGKGSNPLVTSGINVRCHHNVG